MDAPLIHPYATLESTNIFKRSSLKLACLGGEHSPLWSGIILAVGASLSAAAYLPSLKGSRTGSSLLASGLLLSGLALSALYGYRVALRIYQNYMKIEALQQKGHNHKALALARYCTQLTRALGLAMGGAFEGQILSSEQGLLTNGRDLYLYDAKGECTRKFARMAPHFSLKGLNLRQVKEILNSGNRLDDREFLKLPIRHYPNPRNPTFVEIPLYNIGFYGGTFPSFRSYRAVVIHDLPEHKRVLLDYVAALIKQRMHFEQFYFINSNRIEPGPLPLVMQINSFKIINQDQLSRLAGDKLLFVTGAPYVPVADLLVRKNNPKLRFETVGPMLPTVPVGIYSEQIQEYLRHRPLPNSSS